MVDQDITSGTDDQPVTVERDDGETAPIPSLPNLNSVHLVILQISLDSGLQVEQVLWSPFVGRRSEGSVPYAML